MAATPEPISVLGLGKMGTAYATLFLQSGHTVTVWNRTIEKAKSFISQGALVAKSPEECMKPGSIVLVTLASDKVFEEVFSKIPTLLDCTVINLVSSRPQYAMKAADLVTRTLNASGYLHGWVNSVPSQIRDKQGSGRYSGPKPLFEKYKHIFQVFGEATWLSDDHRKTCMLEQAAISVVAGMFSTIFQSLALAGAAGVDTEDFAKEVLMPIIPIVEPLLLAMAIKDQDQSHAMPEDSICVDSMLGWVSNIRETAETTGVSGHLLEGFNTFLSLASSSGKGMEDCSVVMHLMRRAAIDYRCVM